MLPRVDRVDRVDMPVHALLWLGVPSSHARPGTSEATQDLIKLLPRHVQRLGRLPIALPRPTHCTNSSPSPSSSRLSLSSQQTIWMA